MFFFKYVEEIDKIGMGNFSNIVIQCMPGNLADILIFSTAVDTFFSSFARMFQNFEKSINGTYYFSLQFKLRNCSVGEIYRNDSKMYILKMHFFFS